MESLAGFRERRSRASLLIRGFPVAEHAIGPTPDHWRTRSPHRTIDQDFWLVLLASQLGRVFGWKSLQDGRLLNDIHPIRGQEDEQTGHSSETLLDFHTEDAFHPGRCEFLALFCLRNPAGVATTLASVQDVVLSEAQSRVLHERRFVIRPDDEHVRNAGPDGGLARPGAGVEGVSVLFGDPSDPFLRIDPPYMSTLPGDAEAGQALDELLQQLESRLVDVVLEPGDLLLVDNYRCVHGRRPFPASYDGTDRWLRRAFVAPAATSSLG